MTIMDLSKDTTHRKLNIAQGHTLLSKNFMAKVNAHRAHAKEELFIHPLIKIVAMFDHTYPYSDQLSTYKAGVKRHEEISKMIDGAVELTEEQKEMLRTGLSGDVEKFQRYFPYALVAHQLDGNVPKNVATYLEHGFDEQRWVRIQHQMNTLAPLLEEAHLHPYETTVVYTKAAPNPKHLTNKAAVKPELQAAVLKLESELTASDVRFYLAWRDTVVFYGTKLHGGDKVCAQMCGVTLDVIVHDDQYKLVNTDRASFKRTLVLSSGDWGNSKRIRLFLNGLNTN